MSRTVKREWHTPDPIRIQYKLERKARAPQRDRQAFQRALDEEGASDDA